MRYRRITSTSNDGMASRIENVDQRTCLAASNNGAFDVQSPDQKEASNIFTEFPQSSLRSRRQWQSSLTRLQVQCVRKVTQLGSDPEWFPDKSAQRLLQ